MSYDFLNNFNFTHIKNISIPSSIPRPIKISIIGILVTTFEIIVAIVFEKPMTKKNGMIKRKVAM